MNAREFQKQETSGNTEGEARGPQARIQVPEGALVILPLRNTVLFPSTLMPLVVGRRTSLQAVEEAVRQQRPVGIVAQRDPKTETPKPEDFYSVGTAADVLRMLSLADGQRQIIVQGRQRFEIKEFLETEPILIARVSMVEEKIPQTKEFEARILHLREEVTRALALLPQPMSELRSTIESIEDPLALIDIITSTLDLPVTDKQEILATFDPAVRARKVSEKLAQQIELLELSKKIGTETKEAMSKAQRDYFLREQLKAIQRELGEEEGKKVETEELRQKIEAAKMPREVEKEAQRELSRLERIPEVAAEYSVIRNYLDWMVELPWSVTSQEQIDLPRARGILDADHYDLEKVKKRIVEFLAVRKLKPEGKSPILCFVGPPGVGKTSLGQSIARAMNRKFIRQSLGGVHDEAEIRGHRRTYVGALPGNIIQGIRKAGTKNPVFMLDEVDKLSASFHGDPSAALLEVLDPAQNATFQDHYLGVPFDLSQVLFITTANVLDAIPAPLRDRMEVLELPGYTEEEKLAIAIRYLVPRQIAENGLKPEQVTFTDDALREIIRSYTREAGVRQLDREVGAICRSLATRFAEGLGEKIGVSAEAVPSYLGPPKFFGEIALRTSLPGVATGLAWTPFGGEILFVEATRMPGDGKLTLTGQLGDVMKESAQAALSLVKSRAPTLGIDPRVFQEHDIHVHIPAGAIPKDGPSAGVTIFVCLVSLFTGRRVSHEVAMTGEISLRGLVLPVGGIKEKVLAAKRAGIARILLPELNRNDLEEVPAAAREGVRFEFLPTVDAALELALEKAEKRRKLTLPPKQLVQESDRARSASRKKRRAAF
ncbi:MAG: endopeptidase La [Deltaproteobacteria bacterium GWA2_57_13]|nr:MAG: endopeptidase La [Deltaproteobacteria bacterium GWA2_57_13]OGQ52483.1 MAG: endopeptidase La [Deltaproteobacteria bacterium RIFCSPLOWO2_02_FULL_57_26]OGQ84318.1 MAG: endopeptidase La [Deltaproteobacteria bacterium RIFCSPLOWO2_12_FULL_57_22]